MNASNWSRQAVMSLLLLAGCAEQELPRAPPAEHLLEGNQSLAVPHDKTLWPSGTTTIPVCWITPGFDLQKEIMVRALYETWQSYGNIAFDFQGMCPTSGSAQHIRVWITGDPNDPNAYGGGSSDMGPAALRSPGNWSTHIALPSANRIDRLRYLAVHEFGHVLGFYHEQDRWENNDPSYNGGPENCNPAGSIDASLNVTPYDNRSIMHYCNPGGNGYGWLSNGDKAGIASAYGPRSSARPFSMYLPANSDGNSKIDLLYLWAGGINTLYTSSSGSYSMWWEPWKPRPGYYINTDTARWLAGDLNQDGRSDLMHVWSDGINTLLRYTNQGGYSVVAEGWKPRSNYPMSMETSTWVSGDVNGDGRADLVHLTPSGIDTLLATHTNNGTYTLVAEGWKPRANYGIDPTTTHWLAADINGDGRADLVHLTPSGIDTLMANNAGDGTYTLAAEGWKPRADYGINPTTSRWLAGDVNSDGRADLVHIWSVGINTLHSSTAGDGTYIVVAEGWKPRSNYPMDIDTTSWVVADVTGTGGADIVHIRKGKLDTFADNGLGTGTYASVGEGAGVDPTFDMD